jgi:hypothetical protein
VAGALELVEEPADVSSETLGVWKRPHKAGLEAGTRSRVAMIAQAEEFSVIGGVDLGKAGN